MTDALDLIAEARNRQMAAEREAEYWKDRAQRERERCKAVLEMVKRRPVDPPEVTETGHANWDQLKVIVDRFASVLADPYAQFAEDDYPSTDHATIKRMTAYRIQDLIEAAVKKHAATWGPRTQNGPAL